MFTFTALFGVVSIIKINAISYTEHHLEDSIKSPLVLQGEILGDKVMTIRGHLLQMIKLYQVFYLSIPMV